MNEKNFFNKYSQQQTGTTNNEDVFSETITSTVEKINILSEKVEEAKNAAKQAMQKAEEASQAKTGFLRNSKAINSIQDSLVEITNAQQASTDAQEASYRFQEQLAESTKYLFELGVSNIAMNRKVVRELELKLQGASEEELNDLARQKLIDVIKKLKDQEDQMIKTERNTKILKDHHNDINSMKTNIGSLADDVDDIEKNIDTLFTEINSIKIAEQKSKQRNYNKILKASKNTYLKAFLLILSSLLGIANFVGLYILSKRTKSVFLKIANILCIIVSIAFTIAVSVIPEINSVLSNIYFYSMALSVLTPSVLLLANIKNYICADMLLEYLSKYGIDTDFIAPIENIQPQPIPWVTPQIKKVSKKLFSHKQYSVLFTLDMKMREIA